MNSFKKGRHVRSHLGNHGLDKATCLFLLDESNTLQIVLTGWMTDRDTERHIVSQTDMQEHRQGTNLKKKILQIKA